MNDSNVIDSSVLQIQGPLAAYQARLASGELRFDPDQERVVKSFNQLWMQLGNLPPRRSAPRPGLLTGLLRRVKPEPQVKRPRGLYLVGRVGRGKTMLMDLFFECVPLQRKERIHFLRFMQDVHKTLYDMKRSHPNMADPIPPLAKNIASRVDLLCFDEFQINDIADAMILGRLFEALFAEGVIIVTTSNTVPGELFQNRPGADAFKPFIAIIHRELDTVELDSPRDYRRGRQQEQTTWITPADSQAKKCLDEIFEKYAAGQEARPYTIQLSGRTFEVDQAAGSVARFSFTSLCEQPRGPGDYIALAKQFPVILIDDVRVIGDEETNLARRFITVIDALYDNGNLLFVSAEASPDELFTTGEGADAFARTASRLAEMGSESWLERGAQAARAAHSAL